VQAGARAERRGPLGYASAVHRAIDATAAPRSRVQSAAIDTSDLAGSGTAAATRRSRSVVMRTPDSNAAIALPASDE
jgi:hypothetical protein